MSGQAMKIVRPFYAVSWLLLSQAQGAVLDAYPAHLSLEAAEQMFELHSHELIAARHAVAASAADRIAAGQRPNPTLITSLYSFPPHQGWGSGSLADKPIGSSIELSQLFERGNKRGLRTEAAEHNLQAVRDDLADNLRQQTLALRSSFYDLLLAQQRVEVSQDTAALMRRSLDAAQLRAKKGDIAPADVSRLRVDALRAENDLRQAQADRDKAQVTLSYFIGLENQAGRIHAEAPWPSATQIPLAGDLDAIIALRPDVQAAARRFQAAQKNRELARAVRTRDVTLGVQYVHFPGDLSNNTYGVSVSVPLFLLYGFEGEIKKAEVAMLAAEE